MIRDVKHFNPEFFAEEITLKLQQVIYTDDPDLAMKKFLQIIIDATNKHAPFRKLSRKEMKLTTSLRRAAIAAIYLSAKTTESGYSRKISMTNLTVYN